MMKKLSRRDFLKGTAASTASFAASMLFFNSGSPLVALAEESADAAETVAYASGDTGILATFLDYNLDTKPMARMWFIDAMAGATDDDVIEEMILKMNVSRLSACVSGLQVGFHFLQKSTIYLIDL